VAKSGNLNGSSALLPSQYKLNGPSSGPLHSEIGTSEWRGSEKYLGYFKQELITVKP
jgi:hypothetical protein